MFEYIDTMNGYDFVGCLFAALALGIVGWDWMKLGMDRLERWFEKSIEGRRE